MSWHGFVTVETHGTVGTSVACELASWSFAGSGAAGVVGIVGTIGTGDAGAVEVSSTGYWARQGDPPGCILTVQVSW